MKLEVSAIMPAYNAERFIEAALNSLRAQIGVDLEIIVVDDGSTDDTPRIVERIAASDPRVRLIAGPHLGVSPARNAGLEAAHTPFITFLDSDDLCPPGKTARQLARLRSDSEAMAVVGEMLLFQEAGPDCVPLPGTRTMRIFGVSLAAALFRRATFERVGNFDPAIDHGEDLDFYLRLFECGGKLLTETEIATLYRRHLGNFTNDTAGAKRGLLRAFHKSLQRRRASGEVRPHPPLFYRRQSAEEEFRGA